MNIFKEYMYRSPLLSLNEFKNIQRNNLTDKEYTKYLIDYVDKKNLYANIYSSSKELYFALVNFNDNISEKNTKSILSSLYKYLVRMIFRATPFGMYSGVGVKSIDDNESVDENIIYYGYLNNSLLYYFIGQLHDDTEVLHKLKLWVNPSIYYDQKNVFLPYQVYYSLNALTSTDNISLRKNKLIDYVVSLCKVPIEFESLKNSISHEFEAPEATVIKYIKNLITEDFIMTDLKINLSTKGAFTNLISKLEEFNETNNKVYETLIDLSSILDKVKESKDRKVILELLIKADRLVKSEFYDFKENVINIDTKIQGKNIEISKNDIRNIKEIANLISQLTIFEPSKVLEEFKNKFSEVYGEDEDVKLLELLNSSTGLGIPEEYSDTKNLNNLRKANNISGILENWKTEVLIKNENTIKLTDEKLEELKPYLLKDNINNSFDIFFIAFSNVRSKLYLKTNSGSLQATQTYGRFLYMFNKELKYEINDFCNSYIPSMSHKEVIYNHPNPKIQNVMSSTIDEDVIDLLGVNGKSTIDDIYVCLGADSNFYLKDKKTEEIIFPDFKNMHNTNLSPAIIRFLSDLSLQYSSGGYFLNFSATEHAYSPRIEYKNIVLSPQKWHINFKKNLTFKAFKEQLNSFKKIYNLDESFYIINEDHKLYIDINYDISLRILYEQYKKQELLEIEELEEELSFDKNIDINELVFSVSSNNNTTLEQNVLLLDKEIRDKKEIIMPGNDWICVNIYYDEYNFEEFMKKGMWQEIFKHSNEHQSIETIFFIRYFDTVPHIRLRFKIKNNCVNVKDNILSILNIYTQENYIKTFSIVPYYRESYRYGGQSCISLAENCFYIDSVITTKYYGELKDKFDKMDFAIDNILEILNFFTNSIDEKINILTVFGKNKENKDLYRNKRNRIFKSISNNVDYLNKYGITNYRNKIYLKYIASLKKEGKSKDSNIILSIIHMFCNRLFGIDRDIESKTLEMIYRSLIDYKKINHL